MSEKLRVTESIFVKENEMGVDAHTPGVGDEWEFLGYIGDTGIPIYGYDHMEPDKVLAFDMGSIDPRALTELIRYPLIRFDASAVAAEGSPASLLDNLHDVPKSALEMLDDRARVAGVSKEEYLNNLYRRETTSILYNHMHEEPLGFESKDW